MIYMYKSFDEKKEQFCQEDQVTFAMQQKYK